MDTDKIFSEFLGFCGDHLGKSKDMIRLVRKRYKDCDSAFTTSEEFVSLMEATKESIQADSKRTFVYLRHFLNKLKAHKVNTEDSRTSKKYHASDTVSDHNKHRKGIKRPNDCETAVQSERPLKHPRHELLMKGEPLIDLSAAETDESGDSGSEHTDETENHSTDNTYNSASFKTKTMVSEILSGHDKPKNISQNWQQFKFKQSVMSSVKAAASSFSDRLSKTISRASGALRITETKVDNVDNDVQYISSLSRSPSPELPEFDLSCKSSQAKSHSGNNDAQKNTSNLADNKYSRNEIIGSAEITSTTNLDSDACHNKHRERSSKQKGDILNCLGKNSKTSDTALDKFKESACSEVGLKDLEKDINGYTVEMNVSSDDEAHEVNDDENDSNSNEINKDTGNNNDETVDFTSDSKAHHEDKTMNSDQLEDCIEPNVSSDEAESITSDIQSSKKSSSKIFTSHENVILLESDDSSSSDSEDQKVLMVRNEVDTLFEGSDCEQIDSEQLPVVDCKRSKSDHLNHNLSKPNHLKYTDRGISDRIKSKEIHKNGKCESSHSDDFLHCIAVDDDKDESKDNGFPAVLGLVSVDKVEKEKTQGKKRQPFVTIPSTSRDVSNKVKTNSKEEADGEEPEHTKKGKKGSQRQIQMLETLLKQLRDKIEKVRERELSLDELDDEASDYILEDKLQKKFVEVYEKLCKLHKATTRTGRPIDMVFKYEGTRYPEVNRRIMRFINRYKEFPDYRDIRKVIVKVNKDKGLKLRSKAIDELAREAFTDVGNQLQRRRQEDFMSTFTTPFSSTVKTYDDPALYDPELKRKLETNRKLAKSRMDTVVEKYTQMQYDVGDKGSSDDESDDDDDDGPKRREADLDTECTGVMDTMPKRLAKTSRSDRTPLILESSQLEIVNDEEEDITPYFEDTQIDEEIGPVKDSDIKIKPKNQAYEAETQLQSDGEDESLVKSDNESSLSPDAVKLEMDKVIDVFDEGDEIEIVSDCSDSDQEMNTNFDSLNFTDIKVKVERVDDAFQSDSIETVNPLDTKELNTKDVNILNFDHSLDHEKISVLVPSARKPESMENTSNIILKSEDKNNETKPHDKAVENRVFDADFEKSCKNSHLPFMAASTLEDTRQDSKDSTTDVDNDIDNLVKQIAADQETSDSGESDVEMKNILDSGAGTTHLSVENIETKIASVTNKTESDEITKIIQNSGSPESEMIYEDNESIAEKDDASGLDEIKEADTIEEIIAADDSTKLDGRRSPERPHTLLTDKTEAVATAEMNVIPQNIEEEQESLSSESICTNKKDSVESPDKLITNKTKVTYINQEKEEISASPKPEIVSAGKVSSVEKPDTYRTHKTKTDEIIEAPCIVIDSTEDTNESKVNIRKSRNSECKSSNKLSANSLQGKTEDLTEDYDSDVEIVDEYNPNDEYYPEDEYNTNQPYSEEMDSQGTYSSKNLNYDDGDYTENSLDCEEISDYALDSTSTLVDESNLYSKRGYEDEITSTLADTVDIKIPRTVTKERYRAPFVTLKKPSDRKPSVNPVRSSSREDNLDVIEMYTEPDSTPYTDDMIVSSSCQNDIIVLSDSE